MTDALLQPDWTIHTASRDKLGESPVWNAEEHALYWVDFYGPSLQRLDASGHVTRWTLPGASQVGSIVALRDGFLAATEKGLFVFRPASDEMAFLADPNQGRPGISYNDAKTDRQGRYWVGTFDAAETAPRGVLYCVTAGGRAHVADSGYTVCNGPAFSPDGAILYFSDTLGRQIIAYDVAADTAQLSNRRLFFAVPEGEGFPDGVTVDVEGNLWLAHYGGGLISRIAPDGTRVARLAVPAANVTSLCFGGAGLATLYVTTGVNSEAAHAQGDRGGLLLSFSPGVAGLPERLCAIG